MDISSVLHGLPGSPVHVGFGIVFEDVSYLLLLLGIPGLVELKSLHVLVNLSEFGKSKEASGNISVSDRPSKGNLSLGITKLLGKVFKFLEHSNGSFFLSGSEKSLPDEVKALVVIIS